MNRLPPGAALLTVALISVGCASTPPADRTVYRTSEAPAPDVEHVEYLRSDAPRDPGTMTEDQRREWFDQRRPVSEPPRYDQTLAPRVVERVRVVHVERPVDYSWVPFTLGLGYLAYRSHRHHRRYHRHHFHYGYHWGW